MNELALFAGAGGGLLGSSLLGWRTICAVEINAYRRDVLLARQQDGCLDPFPIWDDVRTFDGKPWRGLVDVVSGGFPCQPFSSAGAKRGGVDPRNMWPDTARIIREVRPKYAFLENVPELLVHRYFDTVLGDLASLGYRIPWSCFSALECGAAHRRSRLWILSSDSGSANTVGYRDQEQPGKLAPARRQTNDDGARGRKERGGDPSGPDGFQRDRRRHVRERVEEVELGRYPWPPEPAVGRMVHGVADGVDRVAALGDGQVPIVAALAFRELRSRIEDRS